MNKVQEVAKFLVAIITVAVAFGATFIPVSYNEYLAFAAAILGAVAVYVFPNTKQAPALILTPAPVVFQSPAKVESPVVVEPLAVVEGPTTIFNTLTD